MEPSITKFRSTAVVRDFIAKNPNATREEISEFRNVHHAKCRNITRYCKNHPNVKVEYLKSLLPLEDLEELKGFKIIPTLRKVSI